MVPSLALREAAMALLSADAATLAPVALNNKVFLVKAAFTPSEQSVIGDLTAADFDGSTALLAGLGTQPEALDPLSSDAIIDIKPPATGWRWETTGVTNLPQTIFGYGFMDNAGTTLLACALLSTPVTLTAINQRVELNPPTLRQLAGSIQ